MMYKVKGLVKSINYSYHLPTKLNDTHTLGLFEGQVLRVISEIIKNKCKKK